MAIVADSSVWLKYSYCRSHFSLSPSSKYLRSLSCIKGDHETQFE